MSFDAKTWYRANRARVLLRCKKRYEAKRAAIQEQRKTFRLANQQHVKAQRRLIDQRYKRKHGERKLRATKRWVDANRERVNAQMRAYRKKRYAEDPAFRAALLDGCQRRRSLKRENNPNPKSIRIFIAGVRSKQWAVCYYCEKRFHSNEAQIDHIVPLDKGGPHSIENLCVACPKCNTTKRTKLIQDWLRLGQQLLAL